MHATGPSPRRVHAAAAAVQARVPAVATEAANALCTGLMRRIDAWR